MRKAGFIILGTLFILMALFHQEALSAKVTVGTVRLISDAGIFIALEKGYFKEEGIEVELPKFRTAGDMMAPLGTGELNIATGGISAGLFNAIARGIPIVVVADKGSTPPGRGFLSLMVRKDLVDTGQVKSVKDLKGRVVATNAPANVTVYMWAKALEKEGLKLADVDMKAIPFPLMVKALEGKSIDAAIAGEPHATLAEETGVAVRLMTIDKATPNAQIAVIFYSKDFVAKNPELANRWMIAYIKGLRFYNDALRERGSKLEELIDILTKYTGVKERKVYYKMIWTGLNPDGHVNKANLAEQQELYAAIGVVPKTVPIDQVVDTSFAENALKVLGRYEAK